MFLTPDLKFAEIWNEIRMLVFHTSLFKQKLLFFLSCIKVGTALYLDVRSCWSQYVFDNLEVSLALRFQSVLTLCTVGEDKTRTLLDIVNLLEKHGDAKNNSSIKSFWLTDCTYSKAWTQRIWTITCLKSTMFICQSGVPVQNAWLTPNFLRGWWNFNFKSLVKASSSNVTSNRWPR